jgi:hypothetical protein
MRESYNMQQRIRFLRQQSLENLIFQGVTILRPGLGLGSSRRVGAHFKQC